MSIRPFVLVALAIVTLLVPAGGECAAQDSPEVPQRVDRLSFAQGTIPVGVEDPTQALGVGTDQALKLIDGDPGTFVVTPKPGGHDMQITFVYELASATTFEEFAVPNVLETPSPSQTFVRWVTVSGSTSGLDGPYHELVRLELETHAQKDQVTSMASTSELAVRWVRVTLEGGILVERDKTFFEFSEIIGYGQQESVPLSSAFTGSWKGRGVKLELVQDGVRVRGCYDEDGAILHGIQFDYDSADILPESERILDALCDGLRAATAPTIAVVGHTSSEGSDAYNDELSRRRSEAVVAALIAREIDASRLVAEGRGEKQPIADDETEAGRSLNRRVEIECR